jgi:hypothetical protein
MIGEELILNIQTDMDIGSLQKIRRENKQKTTKRR